MGALWIVVITFVGYIVAYHTYGRFLARKIFRLDDRRTPPAVALQDGVDYVPTRKGVIFGHHYTSIAGTGPIVGPAIGIICGWVTALIWIFVGSIVMGAVHDFGSLVVSMRNEGKSLSEITGRYVSRRARTIFFGIVFLELLIVIAVFGVVIAAVFAKFPQSVFPVWCEVPIAVLLGLAVYRWKQNVALATAAAVAAMYVTVVIGHFLPLSMPALGFAASGGEGAGAYVASGTLTPPAVWIIILLAYAYIASSIPVTALLQPRDYINAWELFIAMGLLIAGVVGAALSGGLEIVAPRFQAHPVGAPPIWPFLFVTIACGAISGFHCLVASGTTPKQLRTERDSLFVGYGSMLMEAALATVVVVAVAAGIGMAYETDTGQVLSGTAAWQHHYASWKAAGGLDSKIAAVVVGAGNMIGTLGVPKALGIVIMGVFIASFAGTTLDTATRIQRYVISELAGGWKLKPLANRWARKARSRGHDPLADVRSGQSAPGRSGAAVDHHLPQASPPVGLVADVRALRGHASDDPLGHRVQRGELPASGARAGRHAGASQLVAGGPQWADAPAGPGPRGRVHRGAASPAGDRARCRGRARAGHRPARPDRGGPGRPGRRRIGRLKVSARPGRHRQPLHPSPDTSGAAGGPAAGPRAPVARVYAHPLVRIRHPMQRTRRVRAAPRPADCARSGERLGLRSRDSLCRPIEGMV